MLYCANEPPKQKKYYLKILQMSLGRQQHIITKSPALKVLDKIWQ